MASATPKSYSAPSDQYDTRNKRSSLYPNSMQSPITGDEGAAGCLPVTNKILDIVWKTGTIKKYGEW